MITAKIPLREAQSKKEALQKQGLLDYNYKPERDKSFLYLALKKKVKGITTTKKELQKKQRQSPKEILKEKIPKKLIPLLPKAFDTVGDIIIFELKEELEPYEKNIAEAYLECYKNCKVVAKKGSIYNGTYRTRKIIILAGENRKETTHVENTIKLKLNVENVYFSPRTANERLRIAKDVKNTDNVLVMFAGCAPFPITIAKLHPKIKITAIEINPVACKYAQENCKINKTKNVKIICGDVRDVLKNSTEKFDKIAMPSPKNAETYLELAHKHLSINGTIYLYIFENIEKEAEIKKRIEKEHKWAKVEKIVPCGQYGPDISRLCVQIQAKDI